MWFLMPRFTVSAVQAKPKRDNAVVMSAFAAENDKFDSKHHNMFQSKSFRNFRCDREQPTRYQLLYLAVVRRLSSLMQDCAILCS